MKSEIVTPSGKESCCDKARMAAIVGGIVGSLLLVVFLAWLMYRYNKPADVGGAARAGERKKALTELRAAEKDALNSYGWVVKDQVARIPLDKAIEQYLPLAQNPEAARARLNALAEKAYPTPAADPNAAPAQK